MKKITLNSINVDVKVWSKRYFQDSNDDYYCILRAKIINRHKGKIQDVNLIDCYAYKKNYEYIKSEIKKDDFVRVTGKLQKKNTKDWTIKIFKIEKLED